MVEKNTDGQFKVEIHRLINEIEKQQAFELPLLTEYQTIENIEFLLSDADDSEIENFYKVNHTESVIQPVFHDNNLTGYVKITRQTQFTDMKNKIFIIVNSAFVIILMILTGIFIYLRTHLIKPFETIAEMPKRLARGQFAKSVQIAKGQYLEEFLWALDVLRESLETQKTQMQRIDRERKTLILSLSHDIKTPLSTMALYIKALKEDLYDDPEKQKQVLDRIEERIQEIEMYMQDMLRGSEEDMTGIEVQNSEFYLAELLSRLQHDYREKMELLQTELVIDDCPDVILKGDMDRTLEALENIIENALKYGDGKKIEIKFACEENCQLISISNNGAVIPHEEIVHMFDAFWRGSNAKGKSGNGLGLYIARQILQKMNGEIFAHAEGDQVQVTLVLNLA